MLTHEIDLEKVGRTDNTLTGDYQHMTNATIMIVDDEPITMEVVQAFLEDFGYRNFVLVEHSSKAMDILEEKKPDLLLLDLIMPEIPGFEILSKVRQHPKFKHIPIIILTGSTDTESKMQALELGATDFLAKPVDQSELGLRVRNTLAAKAYTDQLAYYDSLTNLPNRKMFQEHFERAVNEAIRHNENLALLNIELDNFYRISDTMGLSAGDEVLRLIGRRIENEIREADVLGYSLENENSSLDLFHMDSSVFSLLLDRIKGAESAAHVANRLINVIRKPMKVEGKDIYVTASIGISSFPDEGNDQNVLTRLASSAKDFVKNSGGDNFQFSSNDISHMYEKRISLESKLRKALEKDELILYYQPKVDIRTNEIKGVEALLRWNCDGKGLVPPNEFIPLAEETGLIVPIGGWVLKEACTQLMKWHDAGKRLITMSVNLSARQFQHPGFMYAVKRIVEQTGIDTQYVTLEITESLVMEDVDKTLVKLNALQEMGFKISIDDFGTGYSSLSYLTRLPVSELKIDRSFIMNLPGDANSCTIATTIINLANSLKLATVAEGIETEEQLEFLRSKLCEHYQYQGFLFSRPLPANELFDLLPFNND